MTQRGNIPKPRFYEMEDGFVVRDDESLPNGDVSNVLYRPYGDDVYKKLVWVKYSEPSLVVINGASVDEQRAVQVIMRENKVSLERAQKFLHELPANDQSAP